MTHAAFLPSEDAHVALPHVSAAANQLIAIHPAFDKCLRYSSPLCRHQRMEQVYPKYSAYFHFRRGLPRSGRHRRLAEFVLVLPTAMLNLV